MHEFTELAALDLRSIDLFFSWLNFLHRSSFFLFFQCGEKERKDEPCKKFRTGLMQAV